MSVVNIPVKSVPLTKLIPVYQAFSDQADLYESLTHLILEADPTIHNVLEHMVKINRNLMEDFARLIPDSLVDKSQWGGHQNPY